MSKFSKSRAGNRCYECHFSSSSDLHPHFSLVEWVFLGLGGLGPPGPGTPSRFDGVTAIRRRDTDWLFFSPDLQITNGKLYLRVIFHHSYYFPVTFPPHFSLVIWVSLTGCRFFPHQQITSGKLLYECHFPSFLQISSDLPHHFSLVIWVFVPLGARDPPVRRRHADWRFFVGPGRLGPPRGQGPPRDPQGPLRDRPGSPGTPGTP